jgi:hypothetical protein
VVVPGPRGAYNQTFFDTTQKTSAGGSARAQGSTPANIFLQT